MLFFSRSHKLFQLIAPITSVYRYVLTITICVTLIGIWWFCVYAPLQMFRLSYTQENQMMRQQCDHATQECHLFPSLENTVKGLQYDLDIYAVKTSYDPKEVHVNDVVHAIQASGLSLLSYKIEKEIDKKLYTKSIMRVSLSGGYQQLLNFFEQLHANKLLVSCKNISLHASEAEKYTITCELASFFWQGKNPST